MNGSPTPLPRTIIVITGRGDRVWLYTPIKKLWQHYGYTVHIFNFKWEVANNTFEDSLDRLERCLTSYRDAVALIGVSAGGTAALHAGLRHPGHVSRIITISSALKQPELTPNPVLRQSIATLEPILASASAESLAHTLSIYGRYDQRVDIRRSQIATMPQQQLSTIGHSPTITAALAMLSYRLR